jgi:hypothetical protein
VDAVLVTSDCRAIETCTGQLIRTSTRRGLVPIFSRNDSVRSVVIWPLAKRFRSTDLQCLGHMKVEWLRHQCHGKGRKLLKMHRVRKRRVSPPSALVELPELSFSMRCGWIARFSGVA